jgi:peptide/nickel transport system ATP-binding protein
MTVRRRLLRMTRTKTGAAGLGLLAALLAAALLGPSLAPHAIDAPLGIPGAPPSSATPLGTDFLGRDVLSRVLNGGLSVIGLGAIATGLAYLAGLAVGLVAGYRRSAIDPLLMRSVDILLAFPALVILLVLVSGLGTGTAVLLLGIVLVQLPGIARLVRASTLEASTHGYVEAAVARGEGMVAVLRRDVLPNIAPVVLADLGIRFGYSIVLIASMNYLNLGLQPPAADWGLMVSENRQYLSVNPAAVLVPALLLGLLTIAVNLVGDAYNQTLGRSVARRRRRPRAERGPVPVTPEPVDATGHVLDVRGLRVETAAGDAMVEDVSLQLAAGEIMGIVGESGSGKTTTALAVLGYTQPGTAVVAGEVHVGGVRMPLGGERSARRLRGRIVSYVPQNPGAALNPTLRIGDAIADMVRAHRAGVAPDQVMEAALENVGLPGGGAFQRRYPHQLSGGQQQRVCISIALVCDTPVVILDEPTTGLDVVTQKRILDELLRLRAEHGVAMLYVTHDLGVVAQLADRIAVMYAGRVVEHGPAREVIRSPAHPFTAGLLASVPDHRRPHVLEPMAGVAVGVGERLAGCTFAPRCPLRIERCTAGFPAARAVGEGHSARCLRSDEVVHAARPGAVARTSAARTRDGGEVLVVSRLRAEHRGRHETVVAAHDVSFAVHRGQCVAVVGESGSGKTTIARTIAGLHAPAGGEIALDGEPLAALARGRSREQRRRVQIIFQNPADALNPRQTIRTAISRPARALLSLTPREADAEVARLLDLVRLPHAVADRYPSELSGGERQRVGIARALAVKPDLIVCDEITSALDVSVQAAVLKLLDDLRAELGLALVFITHDLGVVTAVADQLIVLEHGHVRESGDTLTVVAESSEPYTTRLLEAAPSVSHALGLWEAQAP